MKDGLLLLATAFICACIGWAFFAYFQSYAFTIFLVIALISVLAKPVKSKFGNNKGNEKL